MQTTGATRGGSQGTCRRRFVHHLVPSPMLRPSRMQFDVRRPRRGPVDKRRGGVGVGLHGQHRTLCLELQRQVSRLLEGEGAASDVVLAAANHAAIISSCFGEPWLQRVA